MTRKHVLPVLLSAAAATALATHGASGATAGQTIRLTSDINHHVTFIDRGKKGPSIGDRYFASGDLKPAGRMEAIDEVIDGPKQGTVQTYALLLPKGELIATAVAVNKKVRGVPPTGDAVTAAITGGTRAYVGAAGTVRLSGRNRVTIHLQ